MGPLDEARNIFDSARAQARKQSAYNQLPLDCIDVIEEGIVSGPLAGLWKVYEIQAQAVLLLIRVLLALTECSHQMFMAGSTHFSETDFFC